MPIIQIDLQPLSNEQRATLRSRATAAVANAIGSPYPYISVLIRESEPSNLVEAGGWGPYDHRELIPDPRSDITAVQAAPDADGAAEERAHG
jgi:phenylpyruvate tautomerase PptA (4-oxalocrotonate tautomerase family)